MLEVAGISRGLEIAAFRTQRSLLGVAIVFSLALSQSFAFRGALDQVRPTIAVRWRFSWLLPLRARRGGRCT